MRSAILSFVGPYDQIPPMYSALKVNGQKLCDLARKGQVVERKSRRIMIHSIEIEDISLPRVTMRVACSRGTYIRTLCHDIGQKLGCGGAMDRLERTRPAISKLRMPIGFPSWKRLQKKAAWKKSFFRWSAFLNSWMHIRCRGMDRSFLENGNWLYADLVIPYTKEKRRQHVKEVRLHPNSSCAFMIQTGSLRGFMPEAGRKAPKPVKMFWERNNRKKCRSFPERQIFCCRGRPQWQLANSTGCTAGTRRCFPKYWKRKSADCRRSYLHLILLRLFFFPEKQSKG